MAMNSAPKTYNWTPYIEAAATRYGVPPALINSVIAAESSWQPNAVSSAGAGGLMQLMPNTFAELQQKHGLGTDRFDPATNINAGTAYLGQLYKQFGNWNDAIAAYNAGPNRWRQVRSGERDAPRETTDYVKKVTSSFGQSQTPQEAPVPLFTGPRAGSLTGLLEADESKNFYEGLGGLMNVGQTESQPPRTDPAAPAGGIPPLPGTTQTERLDLSGRINELMKELSAPGGRPQMPSQLQYMLAGAGRAVTPLAGVRDRKVGIGELLGALGGGVTSGAFASNEAQFAQRGNQFKELSGLAEMQKYQRGEANASAKIQAAMRYAAQLRASGNPDKIALADAIEQDPSVMDEVVKQQAEYAFPKPQREVREYAPKGMTTVTLGSGPNGQPGGVYSYDPNTGQIGQRLGASETGQDVVEPPTPEQAAQTAQANGLPPPGPSPYANPNLSDRGRSNLVTAERARWEKRKADTDEAVKAAQALVTDMQRFQYLNDKVNKEAWVGTGGAANTPIGGAVRGLFNDDIKEMQAITARITPTLRQPGSGATSDFDARMFQAGTVGIDKPREVNENIAKAAIVGGQNLIAKAQFEQQFFETYQHTSGMEAAWQRYLKDNPIFDPTAPTGSFKLNDDRDDWQTYFRGGMKAREPKPQAPMSGGEGGNVPPPPPGFTVN